MKRLLQLLLAGVFLLSFGAQARVILPKGGEEWTVGSSVQLEWDASGESATIRLIRPDQEPIIIAEDIADTGHYLWPIEELEAARTYRIEITPSGGDAVQSRTFRIIAWDTKQYLGEFDEDDRSRVTHPLEAAVLDKDKDNRTVMVDWVDYRHFLKNNVRIYLHQVGKLGQLDLKTKLDNTGSHDWKLNNRSIKACSEGSCYFVIRSGRKRNHLITSHSFTLGDVGQEGGIEITEEAAVGPSEDSDAPGSVLTLGWTGPEGKIRIDLYQAGYYHQTIKEEVFPVDDEGESHLSWAIPATLPGGEDYTVVLTSLADGTKQATSTPVSIEAAEGDVAVTRPKNISLGRKSTRLGWKNTQGPVDIDLYLDGRRVKTIARNTSPTRVHSWRLPGVLSGSDQYTVRVTQVDDEGVFGVSAPFSISAPEKVGAKQPSQQSCEAAGLEAGCTSGAIKVAKNAIKRECVKYRLYGEACNEDNVSAARNQLEAELASVEEKPTACGENQEAINGVCWRVDCNPGEIRIGKQCRPEWQCPGLALLDDLPPEIIVPYEGPRRCDQNLLKAETKGDYRLASALKFLLRLMTMDDDIQLNWAMSVDLYDRFQRGIGAEAKCQSRQAQAYWGSALCESVANEQSVPERFKGTICARKDRPLCNSWGVNDPIPPDLNALSWPYRKGFVNHAFNLGGPGSDRSVLDFLGKQAGYPYGAADVPTGLRVDLIEYLHEIALPAFEVDNENAGPGLIKGFYWPDQPVVAPEAWDLLNPNAQVHAEFIWRTAKVREALFDPARVVVGDDYSGPPSNHPFVTTSGEAFVDCGQGRPELRATMRSEAIGDVLLQCSDTPWSAILNLDQSGATTNLGISDLLSRRGPAQISAGKLMACNSGMRVSEAGVCEFCPPGTSNENGLGLCQPCGINLYAQSGAPSCSLCPMGQVPQEGHRACMDNPCTEKEYWDITTRSCQKDARKQHKWVQMHMLFDFDRQLSVAQRFQVDRALAALSHYAAQKRSAENDREFVLETATVGGLRQGDNDHAMFCSHVLSHKYPNVRNNPLCEAGVNKDNVLELFPDHSEDDPAKLFGGILSYTSLKPEDKLVEWSDPVYSNVTHTDAPFTSRRDRRLGWDDVNERVLRDLLRSSVEHHHQAQAQSGKRERAVFALHFNGHGDGFNTTGIYMNALRQFIREELGDSRLDLVTFDNCLMASYQTLLMLDGVADWVVGHPVHITEKGWAGDSFMNLALAADEDKKALSTKAHVRRIVEKLKTSDAEDYKGSERSGTVLSYDMAGFGPFRDAFDGVLNHLADNMARHAEDLFTLYTDQSNHLPPFGASSTFTYDSRAFLVAVSSFGDPALKRLADTALKELENFTGKRMDGTVLDWGQYLEGLEKWEKNEDGDDVLVGSIVGEDVGYADVILLTPLSFAWRPPNATASMQNNFRTDINKLNFPSDVRGKPLPGWEPLSALLKFDYAWQRTGFVPRQGHCNNQSWEPFGYCPWHVR